MADESVKYGHAVLNKSGSVLFYPEVRSQQDLLEGVPPDSYVESATQLFPLGTRMEQAERAWVYCKNSAAAITGLGSIVQGPAVTHAEQNYERVIAAAADIGDYDVYVTSTANLAAAPLSTANGLAEGYFFINDEAGEGQGYKIKSSQAFAGTASTKLTLYKPLTVALTTSSRCGFVQSPFANVVVAAAVCTSKVIGVCNIALTASYFFWAQYKGPCAVISHGTQVLGTEVIVGTTAGQADPKSAATTEVKIGEEMSPCATAGETFLCYLTLDV